MRLTLSLALAAISSLAPIHSGTPTVAKEPIGTADLALRRAQVYTVDSARSWAESVAIKDGLIVYVGPDSGIDKWIGKQTSIIELDGKMVLPGFQDSHVHPAWGGVEIGQCALHDLQSPREVYDKIARYAAEHRQDSWITGSGWALTLFAGASPLKEDLDRIVPDRPCYLESADCHSAWVNSKALAAAGISSKSEDPPHGRIERDASTGEPSGTLRESAMELVRKVMPKVDDKEMVAGLRRAQELANRLGITSVQDAAADEPVLKAYSALDKKGELTLRVVAAIRSTETRDESQVDDLIALRDKYASKNVRTSTVKIFADGVIEAHTAALLAPYLDRPAFTGDLNFSPQTLKRLVERLDKEGFQIHIHAIGDRAVRVSLDAHESAQNANGKRDSRHHIAHLEVVHADDVDRFRKLNVCANFQCYWCQRDQYISQYTEPVLGPERSARLYPLASIWKTGAVVAAGSDWPVSSMNPLDAIQVAVTRKPVDEADSPAWLPEERIGLADILAAYTINGAYVNRQEKETGSIEEGKLADIIVLDRNLFAIDAAEIHKARVLLTLLGGKAVFRDPALSGR